MPIKKYLNTTEVAELTGRPYNEILNLAKTGVLPSHKTRRGHYRLNVDAVEVYFGIQINKPEEKVDRPVSTQEASKTSDETHLIINDEHYEEVIERICSATKSIRIITANFKCLSLKPTTNQGKNKNRIRFTELLMQKAKQGVSVQIVCSSPSKPFTRERMDLFQEMNRPKAFEYKECKRNHAKIIIIDDRIAYVGSANVTRAGLRQDISSQQNYEAGILTENPELITSIKDFFSMIWRKGQAL